MSRQLEALKGLPTQQIRVSKALQILYGLKSEGTKGGGDHASTPE